MNAHPLPQAPREIVYRIYRETPDGQVAKAMRGLISEAAGRLVGLVDVPGYLRELAEHFESLEEEPCEAELRRSESTWRAA